MKMLQFRSLVKCTAFGILLLAVQGCSIILASTLPLSRPPGKLLPGKPQEEVDRQYGRPIAAGMSPGGLYIEQVQFVDGVTVGTKVFCICLNSFADALTLFFWEPFGTIAEASSRNFTEYVFYIVYNEQNQIVRVVPENSEEGHYFALLSWASPRIRNGMQRPVARRLAPYERKPVPSEAIAASVQMAISNGVANRVGIQTIDEKRTSTNGVVQVHDDVAQMHENKLARQQVEQLRKLRTEGILTEEQFLDLILRITNGGDVSGKGCGK